MGKTVTAKAATEDILSDAVHTFTRSRERGGDLAEQAQRWLGDVVALATRSAADLAAAEDVRDTAVFLRDAALAEAHIQVGRAYDALRNDLRRPKTDPWLAILVPGGADCLREVGIGQRADTMDGIAQNLEEIGHPRIEKKRTAALAAELRAEAARLRAAVEKADRAVARRDLARRLRRSLGLAAQAQLVSFKRTLLAMRYRESEIHEVLPDRSPGPTAPTTPSETPETNAEPPDPEPVPEGPERAGAEARPTG